MSDLEVRHNRETEQFELYEAGAKVGVAGYDLRGDVYAILHTNVDPSHGGRGLGSVLVKAALEDIRDAGGQVLPVCPFVPKVILDNPEFLDLVPEDQRVRYGL
ncbi:GNAT family N-acetyltransferase [soil metagenome]